MCGAVRYNLYILVDKSNIWVKNCKFWWESCRSVFCGDKFSQKICLWRKNKKIHVLVCTVRQLKGYKLQAICSRSRALSRVLCCKLCSFSLHCRWNVYCAFCITGILIRALCALRSVLSTAEKVTICSTVTLSRLWCAVNCVVCSGLCSVFSVQCTDYGEIEQTNVYSILHCI